MKAFIKTLAISLSSLTLFCSFSIAQSSGNSAVEREHAVERIADLSRSIERGSVRGSNTRSAAKERFGLMRSLAETDPNAVLSSTLSSEVLARLPETSRKYIETHEKVEGELEVIAECEEHDGRIEYFVKQGDTRFPLYFAGEPDTKFVSGKKISVDAVKLDDLLVASADSLRSTDSALATTEASSLTGTTGEKRVLVILVNFQDKATQPFTVEQARSATFTDTSNFLRENSFGQTWLSGDVFGWYTIPVSSTACDKNAIATYAKQAAANSGADLSRYDNVIYGFPSNACTFSGSANVGGIQPQVWINELFELGVLGHEIGHNLGLYHSRSLDCGSASIGEICTTSEYGDTVDLMGAASSAHFNGFQKERLGWFPSTGSVQTIQSSGTYRIYPYQLSGSDPNVLKILRSTDQATGSRTWYYLEKRTALGFDKSLEWNQNVMGGVVVRSGSESSGQQTYLLDMTPATASWYDPALTAGQTFADPAAGMTVTVLSADGSGASVRVEMNTQPCVRANPTVAVTPGQSSWMSPGTAFTYSISVTNNNSGGCANESFNLSAALPNGLSGFLSAPSILLANGASGSANFNISSAQTASDGTYNFTVSGMNSANAGYASSGAASYVLVSRLGVAATPGSPKYSRSQTASVTATVTAAGSSVSGAEVTFTMTKSGGAKVSQTVITGPDGRAVFSYKFNRKTDPTGTYQINVVAATQTHGGQAATSFLVTK